MKKLKKIAALLMTLVLVLGLTTTAFANGNVSNNSTDTGSITIKNSDNVSVAGKTFNAYRILDLTLIGEDDPQTAEDDREYVYTVPDELESFYANYFNILTTVGDFSAQVANKIATLSSSALSAFATAALAAAKEADLTAYTATGDTGDTSVTISNLPLGYYVVEDTGATTPVSALMMDSTNTTAEITLKSDEPTLDKKILETDGNTTTRTDTNNVAVGDTVTFELTSSVPDMTGYSKYYFVVTDTLSKGLTYTDNMSIKITYTDANSEEQTITLECASINGNAQSYSGTNLYDLNYSTDSSGETTLEIVFKNFIQYEDITDAGITITYTATLNEDAVIGSAGNNNTAELTFSNNPNKSDSGDPDNPDKPGNDSPVGETTEVKTTTYVTGIKLTKVNANDDTLTGATFTLVGEATNLVQVTGEFYVEDDNGTYWKLNDGTYTTTDPGTAGVDQSAYASTTQKYSKTTTSWVETQGTSVVTATATVDENGVLVFNGLSEGTYIITEIVAPDGYNLLTNPIKITIEWTKPTGGAGTACTWSAKYTTNGTEVTTTSTSATVNTDGIIELTVENNAGTILPSTGGIGTTLFYIIGGVLIAGAAILLITRRRMRKA